MPVWSGRNSELATHMLLEGLLEHERDLGHQLYIHPRAVVWIFKGVLLGFVLRVVWDTFIRPGSELKATLNVSNEVVFVLRVA